MNQQASGILDRALRFLDAWGFAGRGRDALKRGIAADLPDADSQKLKHHIDACLEGRGGEVSARARAAELGETYLVLSPIGRRRFLEILAHDYDVDRAALERSIHAYQLASDIMKKRSLEAQLRMALVAPRVKLLNQFNDLRQGVKFLVDLRAELMTLAGADPGLRALDTDARELLSSWFDVGFLELKRITWETPASLLEKLIEYEAVHAIRSWDDLKHRLEADRRCYAYFHPQMPDEPLIFVQVALVNGMASNVQELLDEDAPLGNPEQADTAVFYSISNCQSGLAGVSFGNFLIKRVVDDLARDLPNLRTFATLSPLPGFSGWLNARIEQDDFVLTDSETRQLEVLTNDTEAAQSIKTVFADPDWHKNAELAAALEPALTRHAALYLIKEKRDWRVHDRVAHFHLSNGARIERLNWLADTSNRGLQQACGIMVNYCYKLDDIEKNHEAYSSNGKVTAAPAVNKLLRS